MKTRLLLFFLSCVFISCEKSDLDVSENLQSGDDVNSIYQFIKNLGYQDHEISDIGNEYLVDGDILFSKEDTLRPQTKQYGTGHYVGYNIQPNITVRIAPSMASYTSEINGALAMWNNVPNARVNFTLTGSSDQDILITYSNLGPDICGRAYAPINGHPGQLIYINPGEISGGFQQRQGTIAHELGHTIGFRHTNWKGHEFVNETDPANGAKITAMHLLGTPTGTDANSLMNGRECGTGSTTLSNYDILAFQFLYPANPPVAGTVPIFRYYNGGSTAADDHYFTQHYSDLGNGDVNGYAFEGVGFFAFKTQEPGTVPIYRYYHPTSPNHYYSRPFLNPPPSGYIYETIAFYAYPSSMNGASPVYRYFSSLYNDHHYTKNDNEFEFSPTYDDEGIEFYAY